jgi:arylsulfate sulfotransferase
VTWWIGRTPGGRTVGVAALVVAVGLGAALAGGLFAGEPAVNVEVRRFEATPLSALATVRSKEPVRVEVKIAGLDGEDLQFARREFRTEHSVPVLGLYPDHENHITFTATHRDGEITEIVRTLRTAPLPEHYPEVHLERRFPGRISEGMILLHLAAYDEEGTYIPLASVIDSYGRVRWLYTEDYGHVLEPLENGDLMVQKENRLVQMDWLGRTPWEGFDVPGGLHHDAAELPDGNLLTLSAAPGSVEDAVVEIDRDSGAMLRRLDFRDILDPERPRQPVNLDEADWLHLNGLDYHGADNAVVVSGRDQSAVVKVGLETGKIHWILGNHHHWSEEFRPLLLEPLGRDFEWPWGQHAPELHPTDPSRILIYDNGNHRSYDSPIRPADNYSRAVEYEIEEDAGTVRQVWQYGAERGSELFTPFIGDADYLENGNRLVTFGGISRDLVGNPQALFDLEAMEVNDMKISAHIVEVTDETPARRVLEFVFAHPDPASYAGYRVYRAEKIRLSEHFP